VAALRIVQFIHMALRTPAVPISRHQVINRIMVLSEFIEPRSSLAFSQYPTNRPYPEPTKFSSQRHNLFIEDTFFYKYVRQMHTKLHRISSSSYNALFCFCNAFHFVPLPFFFLIFIIFLLFHNSFIIFSLSLSSPS
jgi:hypothetical protein